jgi:hypothetical protein
MTLNDCIGQRVLSQYGLICIVIAAREKNATISLTCLEEKTKKIWEWWVEDVSLITSGNEILDLDSGEIYGKVEGEDWELYSDEDCRKLTKEEIEQEFTK